MTLDGDLAAHFETSKNSDRAPAPRGDRVPSGAILHTTVFSNANLSNLSVVFHAPVTPRSMKKLSRTCHASFNLRPLALNLRAGWNSL